MRTLLLLVLALFLSTSVQAHPHPIHWIKHHKLLILSSSLMVAADVADTRSTIHFLAACPTCVETSDLYGPRPSHARLWGESAAIDAAYIWVDWLGTSETDDTGWLGAHSGMGTKTWTAEEKAEHPTLYKLCWFERPVATGLLAAVTVGHARAAYHNSQLHITPPPTKGTP